MNRIRKAFNNPRLILCYFTKFKIFRLLSDKTFIELEFYLNIGKKLNIQNPITFNEKLQYLKLYDHNPIYTKMVDKFDAKSFVSEKIGSEYIIPTLFTWDSIEEIDFDLLPNKFVMKCTHDSGGVIICKDKNNLEFNEVKKQLKKFLNRDYFYVHREWPYKNVKHRIIAEVLLENESSSDLADYKLMCFNGKVEYTFVCSNRFSEDGLNVTFFDRHWNQMPFERHYPKSKEEIKRPNNYEKMIVLAETLSKDVPFLRVDFYEVGSKIYFGELTFFPGSGYEEFYPEIWDKKLGELIDLPMNL